MSCNSCKNKKNIVKEIINESNKNKKLGVVDYVLKFFLFLIVALILTPFIIPLLFYVLFKNIVLNKSLDVKPLLQFFGEKLIKNENEYEDDDLNDDQLVEYYDLLDVNDLNNKKN